MLLRRIAYACLSAMFIQGGYKAALEPGGRPKAAAAIGVPEPELAVRANGTLMVAAGSALALDFHPRIAAGLLAASLVPTTYAGHPFWKETDEKARNAQLINFLKNVAMFGGLLLVLSEKDAG